MPSSDDPTIAAGACPACGTPLPNADARCPACAPTDVGQPGSPSAAREYSGPSQIADYRVLREIGAGGMGAVYEAQDNKMNRRVALKVLSRHQAPSEKAGQRFENEAWIAGRLSHPNLVKVFEHGTWDELHFYSMELVGGGSLADVIRNMKRWGKDDRLQLRYGSREYIVWAINMVIAAARGLDYAHRQHVVHRDVKPMNLLYSREMKSVKIADFGLAVDLDATRMTTLGKVMGTVAYMAPEQILGKRDEMDARTDIYALGVTLFELLTLEFPYRAKTQELYVSAILSDEARRPSKINQKVSRDLEVVIGKALEKTPADRYNTAAEFADDLDNVLHFRPIEARPPTVVTRATKWIHRRPIHAALIGVLAVALPLLAFMATRTMDHRRLVEDQKVSDLVRKMRLLDQRGQSLGIVALADEVLQLDSTHVQALNKRAVAYLDLATDALSPVETARLGDRALADIDAIIGLRPAQRWPLRLKGFALGQLGKPDEASRVLAQATAIETRNTPDDLYWEAHLAFESEEYEEAVGLFTELLVASPGSVDLPFYRGAAREKLGQVDLALQDYRLAVALDPDDYVGSYTLGRVLTQLGQLDEGMGYLRRALEIEPDQPYVHEALAENYLEQGHRAVAGEDSKTAREWFQKASASARASLAIRPDLPWSHINLGASLTEFNRLAEEPDLRLIDDAVSHYQAAISVVRENPGTADDLAYSVALINQCDALLQRNRAEEALEVCREVTDQSAEDPNGFYNLAGAYALLGRSDEALAALDRDFELGDRDWFYLKNDGWFDSLRDDSRFDDLIKRMQADSGD